MNKPLQFPEQYQPDKCIINNIVNNNTGYPWIYNRNQAYDRHQEHRKNQSATILFQKGKEPFHCCHLLAP
jgi:hypothetical protein